MRRSSMRTTGLTGNEIYCLEKMNIHPGDLVVGNSVFALGFVGSIGSGIKTFLGGEVTPVTDLVREGRTNSYRRLVEEAQKHGGSGLTGVSNDLIRHPGNIEFLSIGSAVHKDDDANGDFFTTSADGQALYCQLDAGFSPRQFVFGNVAYSIGFAGGIVANFRSMKRGEVKEYSDVLNTTRHLALSRIKDEARAAGANSVVGIKTTIQPFASVQEMVMLGTASNHDCYAAEYKEKPATSSLTNLEMWNLAELGYLPVELVFGVSVYSIGFVGGIMSALKNLVKGEINELTSMIYEARNHAINQLKTDAAACGADDIVGVRTYVNDMGSGLLEFMAMGTAVKKFPGVKTKSKALPIQAIAQIEDSFVKVNPLSIFLANQLDSPGSLANM